ncbi:hypothetical protein KSW80_08780 [Prevotella copri]|uniref:J domain-containing protein n=1 Tax=Segatella copri TaxID=165179 RepID=A0AAW4NFW1_9BACT|nr:hypothetical protein [Segatella copri]MBU9911140.1 hypothetical protein [Segatella copri]MBV3398917.1 hypothetical protein [Segatella copri]MBV3408490.1 hypothetical protein [Segatella copri]MBV3411358.1 hypothetical protein [Segatella copri]MBV3419871.1 hypothetical protein [Segatella copri]
MLNILKGNIQSSERKKNGKRAFSGIFIVVVLLVISVIAIVYIAITSVSLKEQMDLKKHNIKFFDNLEKEQISALKTRSLFKNRATKDNSDFLREIGPIPNGKFLSSFSEVGEGKYEYWQNYVAYRDRLVYYTVNIPRRDYFGNIEYDEEKRTKYVKEPYWDYKVKKIPFEYSYSLVTFDMSELISANATDSVYEKQTLLFAKELEVYKHYMFSPAQRKIVYDNYWATFYGKILPTNRKAYMLEVRSEHQLEEKSQWIMKGFTTFYLGDFNDSVNGKLLLFVLSAFIFLVFILICLLMPRHLLRTNTILSRQKSILCRCMLVLGILDMLCVFTEIYGICIGVFMQDFYWWCMFCLFLGATITSVFTIIYGKSRAENTFDYLVPKSVKKYLYNRHVTDAEYKSIVVFLVYPLFVLGSSPLGIGVLIYILPVSLITLLLMEIRNFSNWSHGDIHKDGNELKGDGLGIFKDYYLLLNIDRSASEEDIDKAFNKAMTKYNSGIDYSLYGETYKHNIQEAYRVLSSTNRLKPEYDREFDAYRASNDSEYLYSDERTKRDIMLVQKELGGTLLASKKYDTCAKVHNLVIRAVVIYGVFLAIVSSILFVPVKKHTTFGDVYWESLWDKVRFIDD